MIGRRVVIAAALLSATCCLAVTSAAAKPKQWVTITSFWPEGIGTSVVGSASGRGWIGFARETSGVRLGSIRRVGNGLSFVRTDVNAGSPMMMLGSRLVYHLPDVSGKPGLLRSAPLLASGRVGAPIAVPDDPEKIPPQQLDPVAIAAVDLGDRTVWILEGAKMTEGGNVARSYLWACCTEDGQLSELTRYVKQGKRNLFIQLGLDAKKRIWLGWLETSQAVVGPVKLLDLDPKTLVPRTSGAVVAPGGSTATEFRLVCTTVCRVVLADLLSGDVRTATPGEPPKTMASGTREAPADLLDATVHAGQLAAGSITSRRSKDLTKASPFVVETFRGDARGSHPRLAGSVALPSTINPLDYDHYAMYQFSAGAFVPGGLAYFAMYYPGHDTKTRLLAGVVPVR